MARICQLIDSALNPPRIIAEAEEPYLEWAATYFNWWFRWERFKIIHCKEDKIPSWNRKYVE